MADMLVRLYDLPESKEAEMALNADGVIFRRPIAPEKILVEEWVKQYFGTYWASEVQVAFSNQPVTCYLAIKNGEILGFACYDVTCKSFFGPTGVCEEARGMGIGKVLLLKAMEGLKDLGYAYGVIGGAGPVDFYKKAVGAIVIPDSDQGIYKDMIRA